MASRPLRSVTSITVLALAVCTATVARGKTRGLKALAAPTQVSIDGVPKEWDGEWRALSQTLEGGKPAKDDASASAMIAYDTQGLYVAADIKDDQLTAGRDHVELLLGIPGGTLASFELYPGAPGKSRARVTLAGRSIASADIVEAPSAGGYTLEAMIPWSAVPRSSTIRVGFRGAILFHDADGGGVRSVIGTADTRSYGELPPLSMESELALGSGLLRERNITRPPRQNLLANVVGDEMLERVLVYDRFLVVLGPSYREGQQYYFRDLGSDAGKKGIVELTAKDYTGDGKADILVKKRVTGSDGAVEVLEILSYHAGSETPDAVFAQETALWLGDGYIKNEVSVSGSGSRTTITLRPGKHDGIDPSRFEHQSSTGATPVLVPWGTVAAKTWRVQGGTFALADEKSQAGGRPPPPPPPDPVARAPEPRPQRRPAPRPRTGGAAPAPFDRSGPKGSELEQVHALYKKQRGVTGAPRFDLRADLADDSREERLVVHGRDLVIFGSGYLNGRGFAAITLAQFDKADDVKHVSSRDVTGDGKDDIVVRGVIRSPLPSDVGEGTMTRSVVMVYQVKGGGSIERVFAAEVMRQIGDKRVEAKLRFVSDDRHGIELTPGRAVGYSEATYPWTQKSAPDQDFEPLLLPWGGIDRVRLRFDGERFVR